MGSSKKPTDAEVAKPRWRCLVKGCKDEGRWQHNALPDKALDTHVLLRHYTEPDHKEPTP